MVNILDQFHTCENRCAHLEPAVIKEYFPAGDFDKARDDFFSVGEKDVQKFYNLDYPFMGKVVFDDQVFKKLVRILPEFVVSIIKTGMPAIITLGAFETYEDNNPVILSYKHLTPSSEIIIECANLLNSIGIENNASKAQITRLNMKLKLLQISKTHYDLLGVLQSIYTSTILVANSIHLLNPGIGHLYFHSNQKKRDLLYSLIGPILSPMRTVDRLDESTNIEEIQTIILEDLEKNGIPKLSLDTHPEGLTLGDSKEIEEPKASYGKIDGLVLHLPEDQTTDQSIVHLDFMASNQKVAKIELSHMEAAFLHYLGAERKAKESYWLHEPENHKSTLKLIWKSFALPNHFETELEMTSPKKGGTSTWIWDFQNNNRKTWRNQIHRKIKALRLDVLNFDLITRITPKSPGRLGNYKLNIQITFFEIVHPSR